MAVTVISTIKPKNSGGFPVAEAADIEVPGGRRLDAELQELQKKITELGYEEIQIISFTASVTAAEKGSTVNSVTLSWKINREPASLLLDGAATEKTLQSKTLSGLNLTADKTWTLKATDEKGKEVSKTAALKFMNGIYYGVAAGGTYNSAFIRSLTKVLSDTRSRSVTVNAGEGEFFFYCIPARLGACSFSVGGFDGGISKIDSIQFENASGYTEAYDIYRSTHAGLGAMTVVVK